jgi:hypothetical protein
MIARRFAAASVALALLATVAFADQLQWLKLKGHQADAAVKVFRANKTFVDWISHNGSAGDSGTPTLYVLEKAEIKKFDDHSEVMLTARKVATSKGSNQRNSGYKWTTVSNAKSETFAVDLAYAYVPSREIEGAYVNVGKKLGKTQGLEAEVRYVALEVPADIIAAGNAAAAINAAGGIVNAIPR